MFDVFYSGAKPNLFPFEQPAVSLDHAAELSRTGYYWYIYGGNDYTGFDFTWRPVPWESDHVHCFPSQWQRTSGVYLAHRHTVHERKWHFRTDQQVQRKPDLSKWIIPAGVDDSEFDYSWHPDDLEDPYEYHFPTQWQRDGGPVYRGTAGIKYVASQKIKAGATQIFYMDFMNGSISKHQYEYLKTVYPTIKSLRYVDNHLDTFRRIVQSATTEFIWIISSVCDYTQFDFTWHPAPEQREMVHVFPSDYQRRGDTFYIHVPSFTSQLYELELLDWFNVINYCEDQHVSRFDMPVHTYTTDNLVKEIINYKFETPYVFFTDSQDFKLRPSPCLWSEKDRAVEKCSPNGRHAVIPRDIKKYLKTQIYDYPHIRNSEFQFNDYTSSIDIVYISNGEPNEQKYYDILCARAGDKPQWVRGVNGRTAAYQAAARASKTHWFFAVFAKLEVMSSFPWDTWQPDYFQEPKHYIFNARNPINGLEYGHMGVIAYNKNLVLSNNNPGIDFTLSQPHESVPILSGIAHYNQDPWTTWRTAFREVLKLCLFMQTSPTVETEHRLKTWLTVANGDYADFSIQGAKEAVMYFNEVAGDLEKLQLSFDWDWLRNQFTKKTL